MKIVDFMKRHCGAILIAIGVVSGGLQVLHGWHSDKSQKSASQNLGDKIDTGSWNHNNGQMVIPIGDQGLMLEFQLRFDYKVNESKVANIDTFVRTSDFVGEYVSERILRKAAIEVASRSGCCYWDTFDLGDFRDQVIFELKESNAANPAVQITNLQTYRIKLTRAGKM